MYDLFLELPQPLVPRHLRFEVDERVLADGTVRRPVDPGEVRRLADRLRRPGSRRSAVCFLHSYAQPGARAAVGAILREAAPGGRGLALVRGGPGDPRVRADLDDGGQRLRPASGRALPERLEDGCAGRASPARLLIMLSSGGLATVETAAASRCG